MKFFFLRNACVKVLKFSDKTCAACEAAERFIFQATERGESGGIAIAGSRKTGKLAQSSCHPLRQDALFADDNIVRIVTHVTSADDAQAAIFWPHIAKREPRGD